SDSERTESETEAAAPKGQAGSNPEKAHEVLAGPDPEPMQEDQTGSDSGKLHEKSKVVDESDSTIPDPSHQTVTSTPPVIAPIIDFSSPKPSSQVTTPPITTKATSITTTLPEITTVIDKYLETKLDDALHRILE
ncbi:hypothetical protein Tco_1239814, partial [Tanacetum coccineum]